jgi:mannose/fructose/N-acetylgalactosamine-specific phosphotransferase system component IIB
MLCLVRKEGDSMKNIKLARIDSRLSHGKVVSYWTDFLNLDTVIIANDRVAGDEFEQAVMNLTMPEGIKSHYLKLDQVKNYVENNIDEDIFLIVESPRDLDIIINQDARIEKVNIGIIHLSKGKKLLTEEVAVDEKDLEIFSKLVAKGTEVSIQLSPFACKRDLSDFFIEA